MSRFTFDTESLIESFEYFVPIRLLPFVSTKYIEIPFGGGEHFARPFQFGRLV